jgi:Flp pilus assembly protein TadG
MFERQYLTDRRIGKPRHQRFGATTVEFALVIPIIFATFFAAFEFCKLAMLRHTLDNAVYEASRQSILPGADAKTISAKAKQVLVSMGIVDAVVTVSPTVIDESTKNVTVKVSIPLNKASNLPVPEKYSISRSLTMARERSL